MFDKTVPGDIVLLECAMTGVIWRMEVSRTTARRIVVNPSDKEYVFSRSTGKQLHGGEYRIRPLPESHIIKNVKALDVKSRGHQVVQATPSTYRVTSGASGKEYIVSYLPGDDVRCTCPWGIYRRAGVGAACSHRMAVERFRAKADGYKGVKIVSQNADVSQMHRKTVSSGDGVKILARN